MTGVQLTLDGGTDLDRRYREWRDQHPEVYDAVVDMARRWKQAGHTRIGIAMCFEVLRWEAGMRAPGDDGWQLSNTWRSRLAREVMAAERDLAGFFETRELRS